MNDALIASASVNNFWPHMRKNAGAKFCCITGVSMFCESLYTKVSVLIVSALVIPNITEIRSATLRPAEADTVCVELFTPVEPSEMARLEKQLI